MFIIEGGFMAIVRKWGNSLGVRLPSDLAKILNIHEGSELKIESKDGELRLIPYSKTETLELLLSQITPENDQALVDWGNAAGNEIE
jgi:antitoxin MazE